jgi:hypothetical protein
MVRFGYDPFWLWDETSGSGTESAEVGTSGAPILQPINWHVTKYLRRIKTIKTLFKTTREI